VESPEHQKRSIRQYFESQVDDETIEHLEKVASERIFGRTHDVWDVHTDKDRWWVVTDFTNLYSQRDFRSMDYVISFHIGLMARIVARQRGSAPEERGRTSDAWRRFEQAHESLAEAEEAEDIQAVGMKCRECLLAFTREVARDDMVPKDVTAPKRGDFIHWTEHIANAIAPKSGAERLRAYLKTTAKVTWEYVQWLTHASNATRFDGEIAVDATGHVLSAYSHVLIKQERGIPDRCPRCSSYRLFSEYDDRLDAYIEICESCGWEGEPEPAPPLDEEALVRLQEEAARRAGESRSGRTIGNEVPPTFPE
jgi:hypothetical protein